MILIVFLVSLRAVDDDVNLRDGGTESNGSEGYGDDAGVIAAIFASRRRVHSPPSLSDGSDVEDDVEDGGYREDGSDGDGDDFDSFDDDDEQADTRALLHGQQEKGSVLLRHDR